jgi:hypothetical protein
LDCSNCRPLIIRRIQLRTDHQSDESTNKNSRNTTPHSKGYTGDDGEGNMVHRTDTTGN